MDWRNEAYVRVYTRDTTNWKRLGWDGQCVMMQLFRKVDRAGTLDLGGLDPWEAVALHTGAPEDVAKRGIASILRVEAAKVIGGLLVFPNFIEAQECSKSDKLRAKESRERHRRGESQDVTAPSQNVTPESQDVTLPSQAVTSGHAESRTVTPRHSLLCSALHTNALQGSASAGGDTPSPDPHAPSTVTVHRVAGSAHVQEWADVLREVAESRKRAAPKTTPGQAQQLAEHVRDIAATHGLAFREAAIKLANAALDSGDKFAFAALEMDPYASSGPKTLTPDERAAQFRAQIKGVRV